MRPHCARSASPTFSRIVAEATLVAGWRRVRRKRGGAGGDGETPWQFSRRLSANIARLAGELDRGHYRPGPLRISRIAKPDGGTRMLAVPTWAA